MEALFDSNLFPSPAIQWQRSTDNGLTWTDVPGATAPTLALPGPVADDQYRYLLAGSPENLDSAFCRLTSSVNSIDFLQALTSNISDVICNGASYSIGGSSYSQTGVYEAYFTAANGCDSIVTLELTVLDTALAFFSASVCEGDTYEFQGNLLSAPGVYTEVLSAANGCDSTIRLTLEVLALERDTIAGQIFEGERYSFGGQELAATGFYERTVSGSNGCDSTIILDLLVHPVVNTNRAVAICEGEQYSFDGQQLSAPGNYQAQYQSQFGCDSTVSLSLAVLPLLRDTVQAEICEGESFSFDGQSLFLAGIYEAIDNSSNGCDSITTLLLTVRPRGSSQFFQSICQGESYTFGGQELTATGSYEQTLSTIYGCDSLVTLELEVLPLSIGSLTAAICEGESYPFGARQLNQAGVYERTLPGSNGCDSTVILELSVLPVYDQQVSVDLCRGEFFAGVQVLADTILRFAGQTSNGCDSIVNYTINVESIPGFEIQGARPLCGDFTITLSAGSFAGYAWSTGTSLPELVVSSPGWYAVTVTDQQGCTAVDSVLVADEGYTPEVELLDPLCAGEASGSISFVHIDGGTPPFLYSIDGGAFRDSTVYNGLPAGTYQLAIQDGTGCEWARTVQLTSPPPLSARIVGGQDIALGDSTQLRVVSLGDSLVLFDWQPAGGLSCSDCPAPVARPAQSTTYLVAVQDANGCEDRLQVEIRVEDSRRLYAPNAFSPNEDGRNDVFTVYPGPGVARIVAFQVFDRWGNKVYEAEGQGVAPPPGWDGTRKGQRLNPAVFAWLAEVEFIDGSVRLYEGEVSLIR
ncbi:MAG: gliding motility-associated C-terminal domain-containing protein [Phaeodactylibacter sp.]|nr:gliding motility-associated C-terminal domain-containing protein [Phaeodactylibacter sp.]MCB9049395.1 gliding motility-associated C-terminal domain-containing protein [Lewinellaceae bacterium]